MSEDRKAKTMQLSGNDYAKVAERLRLFRTDFPASKTQTAYEYEIDKTVVFTVWVWKDKSDLLELMQGGVTDKEVLRESADANGSAKGEVGVKAKDFEKLETIALGRALGQLGYLASGEIASFEEMEEFNKFRENQQKEAIEDAIERINKAKNNDELNTIVKSIAAVLKFPAVIEAGKKKRKEFDKKIGTGAKGDLEGKVHSTGASARPNEPVETEAGNEDK